METPKISTDQSQISDQSKAILDKTKKGLGFEPNMYKKMAANTSTLDGYTYLHDSYRQNSGFNSVEQEVVLLSVSYFNNCEYCMAAHSFIADNMSNVPKEITDAIRAGKALPDEKLNALSEFTKQMVEKRGWVSQEDLDAFFTAGYKETHVLGIVSGIAVKTLSNYSNHLTQPDVDQTFEGRKWHKDNA